LSVSFIVLLHYLPSPSVQVSEKKPAASSTNQGDR
jgi:hypothetical protein